MNKEPEKSQLQGMRRVEEASEEYLSVTLRIQSPLGNMRVLLRPDLGVLYAVPHAMPTVLSVVLSLFGLFIVQLLLDLRKVSRDVGLVCL
jgi:hypothetical protein